MSNTSHQHPDAFAEYSATGSEEAFCALVSAHLGLVRGTATRLLNGDAHAAQDVAQEVFTLLARKARRLPSEISPAGWLYRQTYRLSLNVIRRDSRRRKREATAAPDLEPSPPPTMDPDWQDLAAELDRALMGIGAKDREAVVLRYLEGRSHQEVGSALGLGTEAARKRSARALEHLRVRLTRRGVAFGSAAPLAALLAAHAVSPAPAGAAVAATAKGALEAGAPGLLTAALTDVPALATGVLAGLAVATTSLALSESSPRERESANMDRPVLSALLSAPKLPLWAEPLPPTPNVNEILARLRELAVAPDHTLTRLQREATLDSIGFENFGELYALALSELEGTERLSISKLIFLQWVEADRPAALAAASAADVSDWDRDRVFREWVSEDFESASKWLIANSEIVKANHYRMAHFDVGTGLIERAGAKAAIEFVLGLPERDQKIAYTHLLPDEHNVRKSDWLLTRDGQNAEALETLRPLPDRDRARAMEEQFWKAWARIAPSEAEAALAGTDDQEMRLHARIHIAAARGGRRQKEGEALAHVTAALDEAAAVGVSKADTLAQIFDAARRWGSIGTQSTMGKALIAAAEGAELDWSFARSASDSMRYVIEHDSRSAHRQAFEWTALIHDEQTRILVQDGLLLRLHISGKGVVEKLPANLQDRYAEIAAEYTFAP